MNIKQYDFYDEFRSLPFGEAMGLYSSRPKQGNRDRSVLDLGILCFTAVQVDWFKLQEIIKHADTLFHINALRFDSLKKGDLVRQNFLHDKIVLFERNPSTYPWYDSFLNLREALEQLQEMIKEPEKTISMQ